MNRNDPRPAPLLEGRAPIASYGGGVFQFAGQTHRGGLLILTDGFYALNLEGGSFEEQGFLRFLEEKRSVLGDFLLLGTGARVVFPPVSFQTALEKIGLGLDIMDSGAACRTYNVLLAENRLFSAALCPI